MSWNNLPVGADATPIPAKINPEQDWRAVSVGVDAVCAVNGSGSLWCSKNMPRPTDETFALQLAPLGDLGRWSTTLSSSYHTCAIRTDDTLWCFGRNSAYELAADDSLQVSVPRRVGAAARTRRSHCLHAHLCDRPRRLALVLGRL